MFRRPICVPILLAALLALSATPAPRAQEFSSATLMRLAEGMDGYPAELGGSNLRFERELLLNEAHRRDVRLLTQHSMASFHLLHNDREAAGEALEAIDSERPHWFYRLRLMDAKVALEQGHITDALEKANTLIDWEPARMEAYILKAMAYERMGNIDESVAALEAGSEAAPRNWQGLERLGSRYGLKLQQAASDEERQQIFARLEEIYERLVEGRPGRAALRYLQVLVALKEQADDYDGAIEYQKRIVRLEPYDVEGFVTLTQLQLAHENRDSALDTLRRAFLVDPDDERLIQLLQQAVGAGGEDSKKVLAFYRDLAAEHPGLDALQLSFAKSLADAGETGEAIEVLRRSVERHPAHADAWILRARLEARQEDIEAARASLDGYIEAAAQREGSSRTEALLEAVRLMLAQNQSRAALDYVERLRENKPGHREIETLSIQIHLNLEEYEEALDLIRKRIERDPDRLSDYALLISALDGMDRLDEAIGPLQELYARSEDPERRTRVNEMLTLLHHRAGNHAEALTLVNERLEQQPDDWQLLLQRLDLLQKLQRSEEVEALIARLLKAHSSRPEVLYQIGLVKWDMGQFEDAEASLRGALLLDPNDPETNNSLGYLYAERNERLDEAQQLIEKALEMQPNAGHILDSLGWVYYRQGRYEDAVQTLRRAAARVENDPTVLEHLGRAYHKTGQNDAALLQLRRALEAVESPEGAQAREIRGLIERIENGGE